MICRIGSTRVEKFACHFDHPTDGSARLYMKTGLLLGPSRTYLGLELPDPLVLRQPLHRINEINIRRELKLMRRSLMGGFSNRSTLVCEILHRNFAVSSDHLLTPRVIQEKRKIGPMLVAKKILIW